MSLTISIDHAGRLVLPKAIRDRFNLKGGSQIEVITVGDHVELKPVPGDAATELVEKNGRLIIPATDDESFDVTEAIHADRDERDATLKGS